VKIAYTAKALYKLETHLPVKRGQAVALRIFDDTLDANSDQMGCLAQMELPGYETDSCG
jgi:hypothetical protein